MNNKDTIYIDIDDEITSIIEKVRSANNRVVALVLPKRATTLQSVVNMKLLKKTADAAKKQVVLITSEPGLLPLAGSVGMYVASTLQSKPAIPVAAEAASQLSDDLEEPIALDDDFDPKAAAVTPVGTLAAASSAAADPAARVVEEPETVSLDDELPVAAGAGAAVAATRNRSPKPPVDKKLAVPNFMRFRKRLILGLLALILLIIGIYLAVKVLPKATVTVFTDTSTVNTNQPLTLSTNQKTLDTSSNLVPAAYRQLQKTTSQQVPATGQQNAGSKASGQVTLTNCTAGGTPVTIKAGTGVSTNGLTFITQQTVNLPYSVIQNGNCRSVDGVSSATVTVVAANSGANYNIPPSTFTVAAPSDGSYDPAHISATSSNSFTGGTDNNIQVVSQSDIDNAKQQLPPIDPNAAKQQLVQQLQTDGYQPIDVTFTAGTPAITSSAQAGAQASTVTVTQTIIFGMFGVKTSDLQQIIDANVNKQIDPSRQQIQNDGLAQAGYRLSDTPTNTAARVDFTASSTIGPKLDVNAIKQSIAGKKSGDVKTQLKALPGVKDVSVKLSPFWVTSVPHNSSKVTINLVKAGGSSGP